MKILFANRKKCMERKGGDTFQMLYTKEYLEREYTDISIKIITDADEIKNYVDYDIIHIFNMQYYYETLKYIEEAKKYNKTIVLSPIYWSKLDAVYIARMYRIWANMALLHACEPIKKIISFHPGPNGYLSKQYINKYKKLLDQVDYLVPNSNEEWSIILKEFHFSQSVKTVVVPNAIVLNKGQFENKHYSDLKQYRGCILEVGRIEPIKNQLGVVLASMKNNRPIVFIGLDSNPKSKYSKELHRVATKRGNVYFMGEMSQDEVREFYRIAGVHVLPSFRESPGLVTLEALYEGCNVVVANSKYCPIDYYSLNKYGTVCNPYSIKSIQAAIDTAISSNKKIKPDASYFDFISYSNVAKKMHEIYLSL